jgi:hypothetical protein
LKFLVTLSNVFPHAALLRAANIENTARKISSAETDTHLRPSQMRIQTDRLGVGRGSYRAPPKSGRIICRPTLGALHHQYGRI